MRSPEAYAEAGRNDPLSDPQRYEHPYDFVSLPDTPKRWAGVGHDRLSQRGLNGSVVFVYETVTPLHVGSGVFERAEDCGFEDGDRPVKGILRRCGEPVLPGSSWKGAVRARFEAITDSHIALSSRGGKEWGRQLPEELRGDERREHRVEIQDWRVRALQPSTMVKRATDLQTLSPAEALFGHMGYRGRLEPEEGIVTLPKAGGPRSALQIAPMDTPQMHRLAQPGKITAAGTRLTIQAVEGRKFYYDGEVSHSRQMELRDGRTREVYEWIDFVPAGSMIRLEVQVRSVLEVEVGALLISAGHGGETLGGVLRFGGYKSAGLGKVRFRGVESRLFRGGRARAWKRAEPVEVDPSAVAEAALGGLIDKGRLDELRKTTTRQRPSRSPQQPGRGGRHG